MKKFASLDATTGRLPERVKALESANESTGGSIFVSHESSSSIENINNRCETLEGETLAMRISKGTKYAMLQDLVVRNLREMKD